MLRLKRLGGGGPTGAEGSPPLAGGGRSESHEALVARLKQEHGRK